MDGSTGAALAFIATLLDLSPTPKPRDYTICSGARCTPGVAALSVAVQAGGLASEFVESLSSGDEVTVSVRPSAFSALASRASHEHKPVVMVAAGTGIAPFRGVLQDGVVPAQTACVFGCRSADHVLYETELREHVRAGRLRSLDLAISAKGDAMQPLELEPRVHLHHAAHVQDVMSGHHSAGLNRDELFRLLEREGASVWVCGPRQLGEAVEGAIERCARGMMPHQRVQWLQRLREEGRIVSELWG